MAVMSTAAADSQSAGKAAATMGSLLFPMQFTSDEGFEKLSDAQVPEQYEPVFELQRIQRCIDSLSVAEVQLANAVQEAKASSIFSLGSVDLWAVGSYLRSKHGYLVALRQANASKRPKAYLRQLRHDFLVVRGLDALEEADVLVDLNFKDHFRVGHAAPWYNKLLAALPQDWVGTAAALAPLVGLMSAGMRLCFKQAGIPLPPWREGRAMLSKWITEVHNDEPLPLVPLPDPALRRFLAPYHVPFRTAVQQASSTATTAAASTQHAVSQQGQVFRRQQQQSSGASRGGQLLPVPPQAAVSSPSTAAATAAAVKAAAAHGCGVGARQLGHSEAAHVPRRIIVGFPIASPPPAVAHQLEWQAAGEPEVDSSSSNNSSVCMQPAVHFAQLVQNAVVTSLRYQQQQQLHTDQCHSRFGMRAAPPHSAAPGAASKPAIASEAQPAVAVCATANAAADAVKCSSALVELPPAGPHASGAASCSKAVSNSNQPSAARARPAFSSTSGVVIATAGGTSPGIVVNRQLLQQQQQDQQVGGGEETGKGSRGECAGDCNGPRDSSSTQGVSERQFKPLDQLLPRMRTVKLGAA